MHLEGVCAIKGTNAMNIQFNLFVKGIGLQRFSLNSEERGWRD